MFDIDAKQILENKNIKDLLSKFGVSEDQTESVIAEAAGSIKKKYEKNPKQMTSLLSPQKNTKEDDDLKKEVEDDFVQNLISKLGLPEGVASQVKGVLPDVMGQVSGFFGDSKDKSGFGLDDIQEAAGNFLGDKNSKSKGGLISKIMSFFNK